MRISRYLAYAAAIGFFLVMQSLNVARQARFERLSGYSRAVVEFLGMRVSREQYLLFYYENRPVGYSGFMDCVTHSLALTDKGLFEVGRYPGVSLTEPGKQWQWFIHRRLATPEELHDWQETHEISAEEFLERVYSAMTGIGD